MNKWWLIFFLSNLAFGQAFVDPTTQKMKETVVGKVSSLIGEAEKIPQSDRTKRIALKVGDELFVGDQVVSAEKSTIECTLTDETNIKLGPKTVFEFTRYNNENPKERKAIYNLEEGHLRANILKPVKNAGDIEFRLRKVALGIRGTIILAEVTRVGSDFQTKVALIKGKAFLDLSSLNHKNIKGLNFEKQQIFDSNSIKEDSTENDVLLPIKDEDLKKLEGKHELSAVFIKDLEKKALPEAMQEALKTKVKAENEGEPSDVLKKKKKSWSEILEEDQNQKE